MREVSESFKRALFAQDTEEVFIVLLTIEHPEIIDGPVRLCNDVVNLVSRGNTYTAYPFMIFLPQDSDKQPAVAKINIDNVDRRLIAGLRSITSPATITIEIVRKNAPDIVEAVYPNLELREVTYDELVISGQLTYKIMSREPWPQHTFVRAWFPGLS